MTPEHTQDSFSLTGGAPSEIDATTASSLQTSGISIHPEYANPFDPKNSFNMLPPSPYTATPNSLQGHSYPFSSQAQSSRHFSVPTTWGMGGPTGQTGAMKFDPSPNQQQQSSNQYGMRPNAGVNLDDLFGGDSWVLNGASPWEANFGAMSGEQGPEWKTE